MKPCVSALPQSAATRLPVPLEDWTTAAKHTLARTLVAEADWHVADRAPIAHVLVKRWRIYQRNNAGVPFERFVRMYSALWKPKHTARKRAIRGLPWAPFPRSSGGWGGQRWDHVRDWVERWGRGEVRDPCPKALNWGGTIDRPTLRWVPVSCGRTANIFYRARKAGQS